MNQQNRGLVVISTAGPLFVFDAVSNLGANGLSIRLHTETAPPCLFEKSVANHLFSLWFLLLVCTCNVEYCARILFDHSRGVDTLLELGVIQVVADGKVDPVVGPGGQKHGVRDL